MRTFKTWKQPYGPKTRTCKKTEIKLNSGVTVLVGCNGAGKSTLLKNIKEVLKEEKVPIFTFNNLSDGGSYARELAGYKGDFSLLSSMLCSSEGEELLLNVGSVMVQEAKNFIKNGETDRQKRDRELINAFRAVEGEEAEELIITSKERWILLDAADSGLSIDAVLELKSVFELMQEDAEKSGVDLYIVISANEYELASGEQCFDVISGNYVTFDSYDDYKKFIIKSRQKKDKRNARIAGDKQNEHKI